MGIDMTKEKKAQTGAVKSDNKADTQKVETASTDVAEKSADTQEVGQRLDELESEIKESVVTVAEGKSITSLIGIVVAGDVVVPENFAGGMKTFDILGEKGYFAVDGVQPK